MCVYTIPDGRDSCHDLLCFCRYFRPVSWRIVAFINSFPPLTARPASRLIVALIRHVLCASHASALPSGGDNLNCATVRSHVQGLCVGRAEDGSTINGANTAARSADVREGNGGVWWRLVQIWEAAAAMVVSFELVVGRVREFERRERGELRKMN